MTVNYAHDYLFNTKSTYSVSFKAIKKIVTDYLSEKISPTQFTVGVNGDSVLYDFPVTFIRITLMSQSCSELEEMRCAVVKAFGLDMNLWQKHAENLKKAILRMMYSLTREKTILMANYKIIGKIIAVLRDKGIAYDVTVISDDLLKITCYDKEAITLMKLAGKFDFEIVD